MHTEKIIKICDTIIEWCFYALLIVVTFSISLVEAAAWLLIIAWLVKMAIGRDFKSLLTVSNALLAVFLIWNVLSCFNSAYFSESFRGVFKVVKYAFIFVAVSTTLGGDKKAKRALYAIAGTLLLVCVDGFFQYFTGVDFIRHRQLIANDYLHRISSSFIHPNDFGAYLLVTATTLASFILSESFKVKFKLVLVPLFFIAMISLFLTGSRGAWLSFAAAFFILGLLKTRKILLALVVFLSVVFVLAPSSVKERVFNLSEKGGTAWERVMLWRGTSDMIKEHPVLGFGVNTFSKNFPKYKLEEYPDLRYTHNCYLQMASEIGIVGAVIFIFFLLSVFARARSGIGALPLGREKDLVIGLFAGLVGFSLNSIVDTHLYSVTLAVFFYSLLGFCVALTYDAKKTR